MRRTFLAIGPGLALGCLLFLTHAAAAATIEGRIVHSSGEPLPGVKVRIWQKVARANGRVVDQPVEFNGGVVLKTDAEGRLVPPDVLVSGAYTRIVAEADGMFAGRSGWIEIGKDARAKAPEITLKRLRIVTGQMFDRGPQPVDGPRCSIRATDTSGSKRRAKGGGKFRLAGVPESGVFLFAEKLGYRFTGVRMPADQAQATFTLTSIEDSAEPN